MKIASVILDIPTQALDSPYTYIVPETPDEAGESAFSVEVGAAVLVPFGGRKAVGFVIDLTVLDDEDIEAGLVPESIDLKKLKPIERALSKPYFNENGAACARFLAERYIAPLSSCIRLFTPPGGVPRMVRASGGYWRLEEPSVGEVDDRWVIPGPLFGQFVPKKNAAKQVAILDALSQGELRVAELAAEFGAVSSSLKSLEKQGAIIIEHRRRMRGVVSQPKKNADASHHGGFSVSQDGGNGSTADGFHDHIDTAHENANDPRGLKPSESNSESEDSELYGHSRSNIGMKGNSPCFDLTEGQCEALNVINNAREKACGNVVLVDGVTGSGKTEVYLRAIEATLNEGRNAIVLVPEISLTPQTVARFRGRFGDLVAVMHSRMSPGERYDQWDFIHSGEARVVVGARSALYTPMANVGLIVIDEEHEGSYKQDSAPRYVSRDVAEWMVQRNRATLVLGSATPSIEALYRCATDNRWQRVSLPKRANGKPMPEIDVIDMAAEFSSGSRSMFSGKLTRAIEAELKQTHKVVLLLNQRGFAKFLLCRDCGFVPECPSCSTSLTYHEQGKMLICHHCGYHVPAPTVCPKCRSPYLKKFGAGTQRVEMELRSLLDAMEGVGPEVPIIRMDADTTKGKGAHQRLLDEFASSDAAVLLGTQMIAKGLDFDDVTLVGVINADTQLHLPDYRAGERTFDLIEQVAGRAGRADLSGRVMVQTYEADSVAIRAAAHYDRAMFLRAELPKRRALGYPPYVRLANILIWGKEDQAVAKSAEALYAQIAAMIGEQAGPTWQVLPAGPCVLEKLRGTYRWHIVVKCPNNDDPARLLTPLFRNRKAERDVNVAVDIDPVDLL